MMTPVFLAIVLSSPASPCAAPALSGLPASTLEELYRAGQTFADFLDAAEARRPLWLDNWSRAEVPAGLLERAQALTGSWRLLAVAVDGCSDSVNTIPFIAKLVEQVGNIDMRIIDIDVGQPLMETHRTPDGRAATPTLILIDAVGQETGCWVERPATLQHWVLENPEGLSRRDLVSRKMEWYYEDAGATTLTEIVAMIEAAERGNHVCG